MTRAEFDKWLETHIGCFPGVDTWLRKMRIVKLTAVMREWFRLLGPVSLEDATEASREMSKGEAIHFGRHGMKVRQLARSRHFFRQARETQSTDGTRYPTDAERLAGAKKTRDAKRT